LLYKQVAKKGILPRNDALALAADVAALAIASSSSPPPTSSSAAASAQHHGHRDSFDSASTSATAVEGEALHQGGQVSLVGVTRSLDSDAFPMLKEADSRSDTVIGDHLPYTVRIVFALRERRQMGRMHNWSNTFVTFAWGYIVELLYGSRRQDLLVTEHAFGREQHATTTRIISQIIFVASHISVHDIRLNSPVVIVVQQLKYRAWVGVV
jgi:hypothetical protein